MQAQTVKQPAQPIDRLLKVLLLALVASVVGFAAFYYLDRRPVSQPTPADQAIQAAEQAVFADPGDPIARVAVADLYLAKDRVAEAIGQYEAALVIDAYYLPAHRGLGLAYLEQKLFAEAEAKYQLIVDAKKDGEFAAADKGLAEAYYFLAQAQVGQQRPAEAIPNLQGALRIDKGDSDAWMLLGSAQLAIGQPEEAVTSFSKATLFVPKFPDAYRMLAQAYQALGDQDRARYSQAMAVYSEGDLDQAVRELQAVVQAQPDLGEAWTGLGLALEAKLQKQEAADAYRQALKGNPNDFNARAGLTRLGAAPR